MSSRNPKKPLEKQSCQKPLPEDLPDQLKAFIDDTSAGRLLLIHMLVLRRLLDQMRERDSMSHAEAMRLLLDTIHECVPPGALRSEDKAARDVLWETIVEQMSPTNLKIVTDS